MEVTQRRKSRLWMMVHDSSMEESTPPTASEQKDLMDLTTEAINDRQRYLQKCETIEEVLQN